MLEASAQAWKQILARLLVSQSSGESGVSLVACVFKTWRRNSWGVGDLRGKFQPVGSFEMEVTSSGLKKNCQAGPPGPGWPLGSLHYHLGPSPQGPQPGQKGLQPQH